MNTSTISTEKGKGASKSSSASSDLISWITQYDSLVVFGGFGGLIVLTVLYTGLFHAGPVVRTNVLFNAAMAVLMSFGFIWVIFHFMGAKITIMGKSFDIGMIIYIFIVFFVIFVLGN
jgi:hypothetical protein